MKSAEEVIIESLQNYGGRQTRTATHIMVKCPFHEDNTPSCGVFMGEGMSIPLGSFHCFGCNESGGWNKFAEQCGFEKIKGWSSTQTTSIKEVELDINYNSLNELINTLHLPYSKWPEEVSWRGFSGKLINKVDGVMVIDKHSNIPAVFFPVNIGRALKGGVKASMEKSKYSLPYVTTKGPWINKYGLFPYNAVKRMESNYVVLVEGPRDALRLYSNGIPALAILGSQSFNEAKALTVSSLCPDFVVVLPDNDPAGIKMKKSVKKHMSEYCKTISIKLDDDINDPNDMTKDNIRDLKRILQSI